MAASLLGVFINFTFSKHPSHIRGGIYTQPPISATQKKMSDTMTDGEWRDKFTKFYSLHRPSLIERIPRLLSKHKGEEAELLESLRSKYGQRPSLPSIIPTGKESAGKRSLSISFQDPPVSSTTTAPVVLEEEKTIPDMGESPNTRRAWSDHTSQESPVAAAPSPSFPRETTLNSMIYQHLKSLGLTESSEAFKEQEPLSTDSAVTQMLSAVQGSPLQRLFSKNATSEAIIDQLLKDTPMRLTASAHHFFDQDTMHHLIQMALQPMWSTHQCKVHLKNGCGPVNIARCGTLRAASLNQLVERISKVIHQPQTQRLVHEIQMDAQAVQAFLRTYKHFCAPHTLLAKLFQRWFVPMGIPFTESYSNYFIMIHCGGSTKNSAKFWEVVSLKTRLKVSGILLDWIREFPEDWDELMIHGLETFIDDNYYTPGPGNASVCTQFLQYAEALKVALKEVVETRQAKPPPPDVPDIEDVDVASPLTFLSKDLPYTVLAKQITSVDHDLIRQINVRELLDFTKNEMHFLNLQSSGGGGGGGSGGGVPQSVTNPFVHMHPGFGSLSASGSQFPNLMDRSAEGGGRTTINVDGKGGWARGLSQFFHRSQELQKWVVVELLTTACEGERGRKMEKFVELAYKLLELNNLQACQSLVYAFNHPGLQRAMNFFGATESGQACLERVSHLQRVFCEPGCTTQIKKLMTDIHQEDREAHPPIPCLGVWVSDLQLIEESEPTVLLDEGVGLIHWRKYQAVSTIFTRFANIQSLVVCFPDFPWFRFLPSLTIVFY